MISFNYSVIIPAYNAEDTILDALASIFTQEIPPSEVIVIDDGSTDRTIEFVKQFGRQVLLFSQENRGAGAATNHGIERASHPILAFLDADDIWLPEKMRLQLEYLEANRLDGVFSQGVTFKGTVDRPRKLEVTNLWSRTTMVMKATSAKKIGKIIDPVGGRGEIVDWLARARDIGIRLGMLSKVLTMRRIRPGSLSYGSDELKDKGYLIAIKNSLDRKRQQQK